jgi:hypothetical protein
VVDDKLIGRVAAMSIFPLAVIQKLFDSGGDVEHAITADSP